MVYSMFTLAGHSPDHAFVSSRQNGRVMTPLRLQLGLASFAALSGAVLINMLYLQPGLRTPYVELGPSPEAQSRQHPLAPVPAAATQDTSEVTRAIQRELDSHGYGIGTADGVASLITRAAIMAYEFDHGMPLTGDPSQELLGAIVLGTATATTAIPSAKTGPHAEQVIRTTQQSLVGLGYGPIKIDGFMGEATVRAIRRFEHDQSLTETGRISGQLVARLARLAALGQVQSGRH
jgi:peptidoglycan hydrolase-like protein with peptidoglycan-binding domain